MSVERPALTAAALLLLACGSEPSEPLVGSLGITIVRNSSPLADLFFDNRALGPGDTIQLEATVYDTLGEVIPGVPIVWSTTDATAASVSQTGLVIGGSNFTDIGIGAVAGPGVGGDLTLHVRQHLATVTPTPTAVGMVPGSQVTIPLTLRDSAGTDLEYRVLTFASDQPEIASVEQGVFVTDALITAASVGRASVTAGREGQVGEIVVDVEQPAYAGLSVGLAHACALSTAGDAWCWGPGNAPGNAELGHGIPEPAVGSVTFWPTRVTGALAFTAIASGSGQTCGLTGTGAAYCWGANFAGQLGNGTLVPSIVPALVAGGHTFTQLAVDGNFACGIAEGGTAYCWGDNTQGQLGLGRTGGLEQGPVAVAGNLTFSYLAVGHGVPYVESHTACGITVAGAAYCWGANEGGQLGDGTTDWKDTPTAVTGGLDFAQLSVGYSRACGVTTGGELYCWGGFEGAPHTPTLVPSAVTWREVSVGDEHTCGVGTGGQAYCWGRGEEGQLGTGDHASRADPTPVAGVLLFSTVQTGSRFSCGLSISAGVWCWGGNDSGTLGIGTFGEGSPVPIPIAGQP